MRVLYGTLVWLLNNRIESFQKRALKIIYNDFTPGDNVYDLNCIVAGLPQLADRREQLTKRQFVKMADTDNCLNYLLPARRFKKSFLPYALFNYQWASRCNCFIVL